MSSKAYEKYHRIINRLFANMANRLYLIKNIDISELDWKLALLVLERRKRSSMKQTSAGVIKAKRISLRIVARNMSDSLKGPLSLRWFRSRKLSLLESELSKALCEAHGADELVVISRFEISPLAATIVQQAHLAPFSKLDESSGLKDFKINIEWTGSKREVPLGWPVVLILNLLLIFFGIVFAVISLGLIFYGIAVFLVFIRSPLGMTTSALNRIDLWIALLCVLSGIAGIFGSLLRQIHGKLRRVDNDS